MTVNQFESGACAGTELGCDPNNPDPNSAELVSLRMPRGQPGFAPAGEFPFFACPKKGNRKKRQPDSSPGCAGKLRYFGFWGQSPNSLSLRLPLSGVAQSATA